MKNNLTVIFLLLMFFGFLLFSAKNDEFSARKILKVVQADTYYVDLNNNGKIDSDELVKLQDISAFQPYKNDFSEKLAKRLEISLNDYLKLGFLADFWAKKELTNAIVYLNLKSLKTSPDKKYKYSYLKYKNEDLGLIILKSGLGFTRSDVQNKNYHTVRNSSQIKSNLRKISKVDFVLVNLKSKIAHKLTCEHAKNLYSGVLVLQKDISKFTPCKLCFSEKYFNFENEFNIPKSKNVYKKSVYKKFDNLELFLINPLEFKKPASSCRTFLCKKIVNEINSSKTSIDIALYGIGEQKEIIYALKSAKNRGVAVRTVVDYSRDMDKIYPNTSKFIEEFSSKTDKSSVLMHNKFFIFDDKKVLAGSTNISSTGTGGYNANVSVLVDSVLLAQSFKKEFDQMFEGKFSNKKSKNDPVSDSGVSAYFSPKNDIYANVILNEIRKAKKEIFVSIFYLTDKNLIDELIEAKKRGVEVLILLDALCANGFKDKVYALRDAKIPVIVENWGGKNHEKSMVIDSSVLIIGSCNFSKSGFYKNDENIILIKNPEIAGFYRDYYLYLFNSIDKKFLKLIPRIEGFDSVNSCSDGIDNDFDGKIDSEDEGCKAFKNKK